MAKVRIVAKTGVSKRCCRCHLVKDTSEFHRSAPRRGGVQSYCRSCKKVIDREHNRRNPRRNYDRNREYALRNVRWLYNYLRTKQCEWEGCAVNDPDMLVFDHLDPRQKVGHISTMAHSAWGLKSIQEEVAKCRVLCANHHQKHTIQQFGYKKWLAED
ncbi:MAG TPA: hypothetical protein VN228_04185 [Pyrinomonadaceae bacterium]|nr:hypothetical protein [Pyrinomonadaceae bacterium]